MAHSIIHAIHRLILATRRVKWFILFPAGRRSRTSLGRWTVAQFPDESVGLDSSSTSRPSFTPTQTGQYIIGLEVSDGVDTSIRDFVTITVIIEAFNKRAGMIEIPGGGFEMGTNTGLSDEQPPHLVDLATFWIDSVEVATAQYRFCEGDGVCTQAGQFGCNAGRSDHENHPINCVTWEQANTFCTWAGKRLPTEAEWEKAARGEDGRVYPWGDDDPFLLLLSNPDLQLLNYGDLLGTTVPVGQHPDGVSFYGVHNMAANVQEWTSDLYGSNYYSESPQRNPQGPSEGQLRVTRGGDWKVGFARPAQAAIGPEILSHDHAGHE